MTRHPRRGWAVLLALLALRDAGCAELPLAGAMRVPVASVRQMRFRTTLHQQFDFSCGSAALATLLTHHYGYPVSEQQVFEYMYARGDQRKIRREGFSLLDMQRYLAGHGFKADGFRLPLQKLIDAQLPAIVLVSDKGYHHFVVVKGAADGRILVGDPSAGTRTLARAAFEAIWTNKLLFVIHDQPGAPRFNTLADWSAAPRAPLAQAIARDSLQPVAIAKLGPGDF